MLASALPDCQRRRSIAEQSFSRARGVRAIVENAPLRFTATGAAIAGSEKSSATMLERKRLSRHFQTSGYR
jgi:hypothetical protein